jgi:hypothetical protein
MTLYSPEPPRKDCILHLPFDYIEDDVVLDMSPQKNDGVIAQGSPEKATGTVGEGLYFDGNTQIDIPLDVGGLRDITLAARVKFGDKWSGISNNLGNPILTEDAFTASMFANGETGEVHFFIQPSDAGSASNISTSVSRNEWHTVVGVRRNTDVELYVDGELRKTATTTSGTLSTTTAYKIGIKDSASNLNDTVVDDPRIYRRALSRDEIDALGSLREHNSRMDYREVWENEGVPYVANEPNARFANTLGEEDDYVKRQLDYIYDARHLDHAAGQQLDRIGLLIGLRREEDEGDERYRERIRGTMIAGRSAGTREDVIHATAQIVGIDKSDVRVEHAGTPGDGTVTIPNGALDDRALTTADVKDILEDTVIAGHSITVQERYTNPFTITDDQTANDPLLGLTSDTTSDGGTLVEDL